MRIITASMRPRAIVAKPLSISSGVRTFTGTFCLPACSTAACIRSSSGAWILFPGIGDYCDALDFWNRENQQLRQFLYRIFDSTGHAGNVAAGPGQVGGKTVAHRIDYRSNNDGYRTRCPLRRMARGRSRYQDKAQLLPHQFRGEPVRALCIAVRETSFEHE